MYQRNRRSNNRYRGRRFDDNQTGTISTYCALDLTTGEIYNCKDLGHVRAVAFGRNKRTGTQNWLAIYRDANCFICM